MLDPHLLQQLRSIEQKYHELTAKLQSPIDLSHEDILRTYSGSQVYGGHLQSFTSLLNKAFEDNCTPRTRKPLYRDINSIEETVNKFRTWNKLQLESVESEQIIQDSDIDSELYRMAILEARELEIKIDELEHNLKILLLPKDPNDDKSIILEIQATSGEEAEIWVSDLVRIYTRYAENQNWKVKLICTVEGEISGFRVAILEIIGRRVYCQLKFESGIHEVERFSFTELREKKLLTSTATIIVMPEVSEVECGILAQDMEIRHFNYGFRGKPRPHNAYGCDLYHKPTGISIFCHEERTQRQNKERAIEILRAKLYDIKLREQQEEVTSMRRSQVGTGSRSEKIRTYNYKDNRATDHRLGHNFGLEKVLSGDLEEVIQSCISQDQQERLAELAASTGS
jgi:peptide chain release factor 1